MKKCWKKRLTALSLLITLVVPAPFSHAASKNFTNVTDIFGLPSTVQKSDIAASKDLSTTEQRAQLLTSLYKETSVQYALIDNGNIVLSGESGYQDKEAKIAPTNQTMYGIGSVSKMFTAVAIMTLVEEGKVDLDTPVIKYIPDFKMADERYKQITVRMLLNHSSGLMGSTFNGVMLFDEADTTSGEKFLKALSTQRLKADPGAYSVYCNDGFTLAEILIERVSKLSFSEYIDKYICTPTKMNNTKTPAMFSDEEEIAGIYQGSTKLSKEVLNAFGAGGIYSTAEDLCRFAAIFTGESSLLKKSSITAMEQKEYESGFWYEAEDNVIAYGLGWDSVSMYPFSDYSIKALVKVGDSIYYHAGFIVLPEENLAVAVLSAGGSSTMNQLFGQNILLDYLKESNRIKKIKEDKTFNAGTAAKVPEKFKQYTGYYGCTNQVFKLTLTDSQLILSDIEENEQTKQVFTYYDDGYFYFTGMLTRVCLKEENNSVYLGVENYQTLPGFGQTASGTYQLQKLEDNPISETIKTAWEERENKQYFLISEPYNSVIYNMGLNSSSIPSQKNLAGYIIAAKIIDENTAKAVVQIPGALGRDLADIHFFTENNIEYMSNGATVAISEDAIKKLPIKKKFSVTIDNNGYGVYYKIKAKSAKKITVSLPKESAFFVYDKNSALVHNSYISGQYKKKLPKDGYVLFVGNPNSTISVNYGS